MGAWPLDSLVILALDEIEFLLDALQLIVDATQLHVVVRGSLTKRRKKESYLRTQKTSLGLSTCIEPTREATFSDAEEAPGPLGAPPPPPRSRSPRSEAPPPAKESRWCGW